jgi:hypothetical protein
MLETLVDGDAVFECSRSCLRRRRRLQLLCVSFVCGVVVRTVWGIAGEVRGRLWYGDDGRW